MDLARDLVNKSFSFVAIVGITAQAYWRHYKAIRGGPALRHIYASVKAGTNFGTQAWDRKKLALAPLAMYLWNHDCEWCVCVRRMALTLGSVQ